MWKSMPLLQGRPAAAAAKLLQLCPTLCDPIDGSPPGSSIPEILQARTLESVAMSFSNAWKWRMKVKSLSCVRLLATPWTAAFQAPPSMGFSRQEYHMANSWQERHTDGRTGQRGGEGETYGESNMDTYITICKIDSQWEFAVCFRKL